MGWTPVNKLIESLRDSLSTDPGTVRDAIKALLDQTTCQLDDQTPVRPSDRLRLCGLLISAHRKLDDLTAAEDAAIRGAIIATRSALANADFLLCLAYLHLARERPGQAVNAANQAARLLTSELKKPKPRAKESQRRRRWMQAALGTARITRGEAFLHLGYGTKEGAFADTFEALHLTGHLVKASSYTRRVHLSGITLLCHLIASCDAKPMIGQATQILNHAEHQLIYRCRVPADHIHRIKITWVRALILARSDKQARAETLLSEVIERLVQGGWKDDARRAVNDLVQIIEYSRMPARAGYFRMKYREIIRSSFPKNQYKQHSSRTSYQPP